MLKRLAILAIAAVCTVGVAGQVDRDASHDKQDAKTKKPSTVVFQNNYYETPNQPQKAPSPPKWYAFLERPDWWIVIIGAITAGVICCQSIETRRAANAAMTAAEAALKQADAQMTSERAWLVIRSSMEGFSPNEGDPLSYWWIVENKGSTSARIIETQCIYEVVTKGDPSELSRTPTYPEPIVLNGFLLPPGASADYSTFLRSASDGHIIAKGELDADVLKSIMIGHSHLRAYGYVAYLDAFGKRHESRYCEHYVWPTSTRPSRAAGFRPLLSIPPDYTKHT
ncbi:hypothetical protein [Acidicapsa acidisoli]|uniref:hypothetical protein n=1 Tax=Acidicapsa acidisoli TaxID=1615681 RepID=UPI0021E0879E|nr:hypothetical protein [Acidicapsa acidisoli]